MRPFQMSMAVDSIDSAPSQEEYGSSRRRHLSRWVWILGLGLSLCWTSQRFSLAEVTLASDTEAASLEAAETATRARLLSDVQVLADDEFEGRGVGTRGLELAAEYLRVQFELAGLDMTAVDGSPFQQFEITGDPVLTEPNSLQLIGPDGEVRTLTLHEQFTVCSFGQAGSFSAPLVFCGYGIDSDDHQWNDFQGLDLDGKVAIIVRRVPFQSDPHGVFSLDHGAARHATLTNKLSHAFRRGAVGVLFVNDPYTARSQRNEYLNGIQETRDRILNASQRLAALWSAPHAPDGGTENGADPHAEADDEQTLREELRSAIQRLDALEVLLAEHQPDPLMEFGYSGSRAGRSIPVMHLQAEICDLLLRDSLGMTLAEWEQAVDTAGQPHSVELTGWKAEGVSSYATPRVPVANVIGVLPGSGPLAHETIILGAHYDHIGMGGEGSMAPGVRDIHNGADDNASGTAALLELARRLAVRETPPARRIVFIGFTGEERGLLGSAEYVRNPIFPLEDTVAMLNMDMVGRLEDNKLTVYGVGTSPIWDPLLEEHGSHFLLVKQPEGMGPSDHASFYPHRIPVLHFFTGLHNDYHRPSDVWEKLNIDGMAQIVQLVELLTLEVSEAPARPEFTEVTGRAQLTRTGNRPYFGSIPDFGTTATGYAIQGAAPGSPADRAGLKAGDVIVKLGEHEIASLDDFDLALRKFRPGEEVVVTVLRMDEQVELKVTLGAPRE